MSTLMRFLCSAYIFFLPVQFSFANSRIAPSDLFIIAFAVLAFRHLRIVRQAWTVFHLALIGVFLVGTTLTAIRLASLTGYILINKDFGLFVLLLTYAVITTMAREWVDIRSMLKIFVLSTTLHAALSVAGLLMMKLGPVRIPFLNQFVYENSRAAGMLIDPNAFGGLVLTALVIQAATYSTKEPIIRSWLGFASILILSLGLLFTLSRSAWLGFAAAVALGILLRPKLLVAYAGPGLAAACVLFVIGASNIGGILAVANRPNTAQQRLDQIQGAIPMFSDHPFLGAGLGAYLEQHGGIIHDTTFWMLAEFGLLGICVFAGLIGSYFWCGFKAFRFGPERQRPVVLGLICAHMGLLVISFGIEAFYQRHWWFVMGLIASAYAMVARDPLVSFNHAENRINRKDGMQGLSGASKRWLFVAR